MAKRMRKGKSSELIVAGQLIRQEVDIYVPYVDDRGIDLVARVECPDGIRYHDLQVKSVRNYNRIIGVKSQRNHKGSCFMVIHYRHDKKPDEFFYLTKEQVTQHHKGDSEWGDLIFNKAERAKYSHQTLSELARILSNCS